MSDEKTNIEVKKENKIEVQNLIIAKTGAPNIIFGESGGLIKYIHNNIKEIEAVFWNETEIQLLLHSKPLHIAFVPELSPASSIFFSREEKRRNEWDDDAGKRVWEGEYEPVQFSRRNLIKFLKQYSHFFDDGVKKAVQNLKISEKTTSESILLDEVSDNERELVEHEETSNLPLTFKAHMPIFDGIFTDLEFEAKVVKRKDNYGREKEQKIIEVRCVNAREAMKNTMKFILDKIENTTLPLYYGKIRNKKEEKIW